MDDQQIIELYWKRSEDAIAQTRKKYGKLCSHVAYNILGNRQDSEECVNDTYLKAWNAIPPSRPQKLSAFLCRITRNQALKRYESNSAEKRGGGQVPLALEELAGCIPDPDSVTAVTEQRELTRQLNAFLAELSAETRKMFLRRYWAMEPVREIAKAMGISESKVKVTLHRTRKRLKIHLEQEGIVL